MAEPIFGRDVGFYVFQLPVYEFFQGWLVTLLILTTLGPVSYTHLDVYKRQPRRPTPAGYRS